MKTFNSKIILFGEYAVLNGAKLLAVPFSKFRGNLSIPDSYDDLSAESKESNQILKSFFKFLSTQINFLLQPNFEQMQQDVDAGLFFSSSIPQNYGVGSSGALIAAIYDQYVYNSVDFKTDYPISSEELQLEFAQMESYFHGQSSGTDPLVSYLNNPIVINGILDVETFSFPKDITVFLIDTEKPSKTQGLVNLYLAKRANKNNAQRIDNFVSQTDQCVSSFLNKDSDLFTTIKQLESTEKELLPEMFQKLDMLKNMDADIKKNTCIKLCGSGGGGFLLGFTPAKHFNRAKECFQRLNIPIIPLSNSENIS